MHHDDDDRYLPLELAYDECLELLGTANLGRLAVGTPAGPHVVPLNYSVVGNRIVVATAPYSALATYGPGSMVAFEVDQFDRARSAGWSVVVRGRARTLADPDDVARLKQSPSAPEPWAGGVRDLFFQISLTEVSGRRVGPSTSSKSYGT